jgi:Ca-activated chloride channel homolog
VVLVGIQRHMTSAAVGGAALAAVCGVLWWVLCASLAMQSAAGTEAGAPAVRKVARTSTEGFLHYQKSKEPAGGGFSLKVNVDLVTVDAIVRDKQGALVTGLRAEDFAIYDNGIAQQVTHFSRDELPLAIAVLIDRSPSVANYLFELVSTAWKKFERLKPSDQVVLFSFDKYPTRLTDLTIDRQLIGSQVADIVMGDNTNIYDALVESARYLQTEARERRHAIIMISDNYTNLMHYDDKDALRALLAASATLFSVKAPSQFHWASPIKNPKLIELIARDTGGKVLDLGAAKTIGGALDNAIEDLRRGYTLGFAPSRPGDPGSFHTLKVRLVKGKQCPSCTIQARSGYYAGK